MTNTPIDEYIFWKNIIEDKVEAGEAVPEKMFALLENAEKKTLYHLMEKYDVNAPHKEILH